MNTRRWLAVVLAVLVVGGAATLYWLPDIVRRAAVARIHAITGRPVRIGAVELSVVTGRFAVLGFRLAERDGVTPFADFQRLDGRLHLPSLLLGHVWLRELTLSDSTVRLVRLPDGAFNISDLVQGSETTEKRTEVTVDRFQVVRGRATLEDQALAQPRTWSSEEITIDAYGVSTRKGGGRATGSSVIAGAPASFEITDLRLHPVHLEATAKVTGLDVTPASVYLPPDAHVRLERGRVTSTVAVTVDARDGIRADAHARLLDVVLLQPGNAAGTTQPLARAPALDAEVAGFGYRDGHLRLDRLVVDSTMSVRDPTSKRGAAFQSTTVRANVTELTWPATTPGRIDAQATVPGGGLVAVVGTVRPPPAATQLSVRVSKLNLAPWAQFIPLAARITGIAEADLRINEPFAAGIPARVGGVVAVNGLTVAEGPQDVLRARRVEASGLEVQWPSRVAVTRVTVTGPTIRIDRDAAGTITIPLQTAGAATPRETTRGARDGGDARLPRVTVGEVVIRDGALGLRDASVTPAARLDVSAVDASVRGTGWPLQGPLDVRASLRPPGGGHVRVTGRVGVQPITADVRVQAAGAELAPYQPYLPTTARVTGAVDADLAIVLASLEERRVTARGSAAVARLDVRDGQRTVVRAERVAVTGVDAAWPERVAMTQLALTRPWLLLERDDAGALGLRALAPTANGAVNGNSNGNGGDEAEPLTVTIARLTAEDGGIRVVDRAITPAFAVDIDAASLRADGLSTAAARPARFDLTARVAGTAELTARGTMGTLGGPLAFDLDGELREFAVPRANSYLQNQVGWTARAGRLTTKLRGRLQGDALSARTDIRLHRLQLVRATNHDAAQSRIGLPLGMITALMKNSRGDINVSFPVGGKLSDPRFDFREAMWGAIRTVAINAITLPVSWVGRVKFTQDSRIERIEIDPLTFEPGTADLTPDGQARVPRLKAFLDELPEVRLALTPIVAPNDVPPDQRRAPADLAERRLEVVRTALQRAGVDPGRLNDTKAAERPGAGARVELEVLEPEGPRSSKVRDVLRRFGVPLEDTHED